MKLLPDGHLRLVGGSVHRDPETGDVTVTAPTAQAKASALLIGAYRDPEYDTDGNPLCTKCRNPDICVVIEFPEATGAQPLRFCRGCVDRPPGRPLTVQFR
jgi:hypothetical protein